MKINVKFHLKGLIFNLMILCTIFEFVNGQRQCFSCDSTHERNCAVDPKDVNIKFKKCDSMLSYCAMSIVNSITYRGCSGEIARDKDYYKECDGQLCNDIIWPPGRQKCFQCEGEECIKEQIGRAKPCVRFLEQGDGCFTDVINKTMTIRGCISDDRKLSDNAIKCPYNSCNFESGLLKRTCIQCDASKTGCKRVLPPKDPTKMCILDENLCSNCTVDYLLGRSNETCFIYHRLNKVERGCTKNRPDLQADKFHFSTCDGDKCNNKCLNKTQCVVCNSADEIKCKNNPEELKLKVCSLEETSCYAKLLDNNEIIRDCGIPWDKKNSYICQENGCNTKQMRKCYSCSSMHDPNCSQWTNSNAINEEYCNNPNDECLILITNQNYTVRGCKSSILVNNSKQNLHHICNGNLCNSGIFPESRLKCYQCQGTEICNRDQLSNRNAISCIKYDPNDECIEFVDITKNMIRACKSDFDLLSMCEKQGNKCKKCNFNGCNHQKMLKKPLLSCFECNDDIDIPRKACKWTQTNQTLIKCKTDIMFHDDETCFIHTDKNGSVSRGCTNDLKVQKSNQYFEIINNNNLCNFNGCNHMNVIKQSCVQCQSNISGMETCKSRAQGIEPTVCTEKFQYFEKRGCFIKINSESVVTRGCSFSLTNEEHNECVKLQNKNCKYCQDDNCNVIDAPAFFGKSSQLKQSFGILTLIMIISILRI